jgi:predicted ATPase
LELGLPQRVKDDPFPLDPEVKRETIELRGGGRWLMAGERNNATAFLRNDVGERVAFPFELWRGESVLAQIRDPRSFPIAADVRARLLDWRLYHHFRTDAASPMRTPQLGVRTPTLAPDGHDLAAAFATIWFVGDSDALAEHVSAAFAGCRVRHEADVSGRFELLLDTPSLNRPLRGSEWSDGTLRYLCLLVALSSPRPPWLLAFNEPETSLHPDLMAPLARLLVDRSQDSQVWVTTHSAELADRVAEHGAQAVVHRLRLAGGETALCDPPPLG